MNYNYKTFLHSPLKPYRSLTYARGLLPLEPHLKYGPESTCYWLYYNIVFPGCNMTCTQCSKTHCKVYFVLARRFREWIFFLSAFHAEVQNQIVHLKVYFKKIFGVPENFGQNSPRRCVRCSTTMCLNS